MDNKKMVSLSPDETKSKDYVVILRGKNKGFFMIAHSLRTKKYNSLERRRLKEYEKNLFQEYQSKGKNDDFKNELSFLPPNT